MEEMIMCEEQAIILKPGRHPTHVIYVVDDETMIGEVVEVILKLEGFEPKLFSNPEFAYQSFVRETPKPTLLLTDFLMSPINGMELIQRCKMVDPTLGTILYSGNVREDIMQYYSTKPDGFIAKPFLPKALVTMVQNVINNRPH